MRQLYLWSLLLLLCKLQPLKAQDFSNAPQSTTVSGSQRLASNEVDHFRGQPQITFPIFAYQKGQLSDAISLNYFPGGIRVEEMASTTGLGWAMNAGGMVTRSMRGLPDDYPLAGYRYLPALSATMTAEEIKKYGKGEKDSEADVFTFQAGGISGKFYIGKDGSVVQVPQTKMKIEPLFNPNLNPNYTLAGFNIITEQGIKYEFREIETFLLFDAANPSSLIHNKHIASAWHLTKVSDAFDRHQITYQYLPSSTVLHVYLPESRTLDHQGITISEYSGRIRQEIAAKRLSQINLPYNQKVTIDYKENLETNDLLVNNINIYDNNQFRSGFHLEYYYTSCEPNDVNKNKFITNGEFKLPSQGVNLGEPRSTRAFLRRIIEMFPNARNLPTTFYYNDDVFLPSREEPPTGTTNVVSRFSQDHWGFYNGALNTTLLPNSVTVGPGGNRDHNDAYVKAGSLEKIVFPGGAIREFEFEAHDRLHLNTVPQSQNLHTIDGSSVQITLSQYYSNNHHLEMRMERYGHTTPPFSGSCDYTIRIKNSSGTIVATKVLSLFALFYAGMDLWDIQLPNGTYTLETVQPTSCSLPGDMPINFSWTNTVVANYKVKGGGLRIKKITDHPGNGLPPLVKEYRYLLADGQSSSGYVGFVPKYDYYYTHYANATTSSIMRVIQSEALNNLNFVANNPVGYSRVEVIEGTTASNSGRTIYEFTSLNDIMANLSLLQYPFAPADIANWGLGLPKIITVKDASGNEVKKEENKYRIIDEENASPNFKSLKLGLKTAYWDDRSEFFFTWYSPRTGRAELLSTEETRKYKDGSQTVTKTTFEYNTINYKVSKVIKDIDKSAGKKIESRIYYTTDYNLASGAVKLLKDKDVIVKIATEEWITGGGTEDHMTGGDYMDYTQVNGMLLPWKKYIFKSAAPVPLSVMGDFNPTILSRKPEYFENTAEFTKYDDFGFLLETKVRGGKYASVLLGGDKQTPMAQVQNAAYGQIAHSSFELPEKGNWTYAGTPVADATAVTGQYVYPLSGGQVSSLTLPSGSKYYVSFWGKGGTPAVTGATLLHNTANAKTGWTYYQYEASGGVQVRLSGTGVIDELRLFPEFSQMTTAVTLPNVGIISKTDHLNATRYNEYDAFNRLILIRDDNKEVYKKFEYGISSLTHTDPIWEYTEGKRCQAVAPYGNTGYLELEQVDINPNSLTFNTKKWVISEKVNGCFVFPIWQPTGQERCKKLPNGDNSGYYEFEQQDINPYSSNYGTKTWADGGYNRSKCPDLCIGVNKKIINGICEIGQRILVRSRPNADGGYLCFYVYEWSDGSRSSEFSEPSDLPCDF